MTPDLRRGVIFGTAALCLLLAGCGTPSETPPAGQSQGLPDFGASGSSQERKKKFFAFLRPLVEKENGRILRQRRRLLSLHREHREKGVISWTAMKWLEGLLEEYEVEGLDVGEISHWDNLLRRVDIVPVELALVQAAKETGWGTSRFAREGNNFFGERCFVEGCGIVPGDRMEGATHEVTVFATAEDSVRSYVHNLNTHGAYRRFRRLRSWQRAEGKRPDAYFLVEGLPQYSERRFLYIDEIRVMIESNRSLFDS